MADISKINVNGTIYNIKDTTARSSSGGSVDLSGYATIGYVDNKVTEVATGDVDLSSATGSVSVYDFGAKGDGVTDDTAAIQAAIDSGYRNVYLPGGNYLVTDTIHLYNGVQFFGVNPSYSNIYVPYDFGEDKAVLQIDSQMVHIHDIRIHGNINGSDVAHNEYYPSTCGTGIYIPQTGDRQWSKIDTVYFTGLNKAIHYNNSYYHNCWGIEIFNCNFGFYFTNFPVGGIDIHGGHFRDIRDSAIYDTGCNNVNFISCVFEWNKYHIRTEAATAVGEGGLTFIGCYLSDAPYKALLMHGGSVSIDCCNMNYLAGDGGRATDEYPNGYYAGQEVKDAKTEYLTCNIDVTDGQLYLKHIPLGFGSWGDSGMTYGTPDNGNSIEIRGDSKVVFDDVSYIQGGLLHVESNANSLEFADKVDNYIINGTFARTDLLSSSMSGIGSVTNEIIHTPYGGNGIKLTFTGTNTFTFKYKIPGRLVGKPMLIGMIVGQGVNVGDSILSPVSSSFTLLTDLEYKKYYYPTDEVATDGNRTIRFKDFPYMTEYVYAPVVMNAEEGEIQFYASNWEGECTINIHSMFLIEKDNFCKVSILQDVRSRADE